MGDNAISRVEAWLAVVLRYDAEHVPVNDVRELLSLARSNRDVRTGALIALGSLRDDMTPEDVSAVQRFLDRLSPDLET